MYFQKRRQKNPTGTVLHKNCLLKYDFFILSRWVYTLFTMNTECLYNGLQAGIPELPIIVGRQQELA
ncbi:hypothetical protein SATMO3_50920 [Sporomusa aerivorans]